MESNQDYFEDIKTIKKIMEESSRFLSLSGLSGLFAGSFALLGGVTAYLIFIENKELFFNEYINKIPFEESGSTAIKILLVALIVLTLAVGSALYFSFKRAKAQGVKIWTPISKRLLLNFLIPLIAGGAFVSILIFESQWQLVVPSMLIFYGLALVNSGKFTYSEVFYLGLAEIITGLAAAFFPEYVLLSWCFGFGLLHIIYGLIMYRKYEV